MIPAVLYPLHAAHRLAYDPIVDSMMAIAAATYTPKHRALVSA